MAGYLSTDFNIHGMWPNNWDGTYPQNCGSTPFSITSSTQNLLETCWVSYNGSPQTFWEHEWSKHGTCVSPTITCDNYFSKTANLYLGKMVLQTLSIFKIVPSNTQLYTVNSFLESFTKVININCARISNTYYLTTVQFCYDLNFNWIDCHTTTPQCGSGFLMPTS